MGVHQACVTAPLTRWMHHQLCANLLQSLHEVSSIPAALSAGILAQCNVQAGQTQCGADCCSDSEVCVNGACCSATSLCSSTCCPPAEVCLDPNAANPQCCAPTQFCQVGSQELCCAAGSVCLSGECCQASSVCGQLCCPDGMVSNSSCRRTSHSR